MRHHFSITCVALALLSIPALADKPCRIDGVHHEEGALNPSNRCQVCRAGSSPESWSNVADGTSCEDGSACSTGDTCQAGACTGGPAPVCDDRNICTVDSCDAAVGCVNERVADGAACDMWVTDGPVYATALHGDTLYLSGFFRWISPRAAGSFVPFDEETAEAPDEFPEVAGEVLAAAADGAGGWYIGGRFSRVGDQRRIALAHILSDGTVSDWNPCDEAVNACHEVESIAVGEGLVYVVAVMYHRDGIREGLAALDRTTGQLTAWNPDPFSAYTDALEWPPSVILLGGNTLFVGAGRQSGIGSATRLWAFDATTAEVRAWMNTDEPVRALARSGDTLYVGGGFDTIDGETRLGLAAIDIPSMEVSPWRSDVVGGLDPYGYRVSKLALAGDTLFVGGAFDTIGGRPRSSLAALDATTGAVTDWDPSGTNPGNAPVTALAVGDGAVYAATPVYDTIEGLIGTIRALDDATGAPIDWSPEVHRVGAVNLIAAASGTVWVGGVGFTLGGVMRHDLAAIDVRTGRPTDWNPNADCFGSEYRIGNPMVAAEDRLYIAGSKWGGSQYYSTGVEALDTSPGATECLVWSQNQGPRNVLSLAVGDDTVYVAGLQGPGTVAMDAATGSLKSWDADLSRFASPGSTRAKELEVVGDTVYLGGSFNTVRGELRNNLAAVDPVTGQPTSWNPDPQPDWVSIENVGEIEVRDGLVYVAGRFDSIGGERRIGLAAIDATTGLATSWRPRGCGGSYFNFEIGDGVLYGAQEFGGGGGACAVDLATGARRTWDPYSYSDPLNFAPFGLYDLDARGDVVFLAGRHGILGGHVRSGIAAVAGASAPPPPDRDEDGVADGSDACPDSVDSATVVLRGCDSGVPNAPLEDGCTIADRLAGCDEAGHGPSVSCVASVATALERDGAIASVERGRLQSCAAQPPPGACRIEGEFPPAGARNPQNPCQACRPEISTSSWSSVIDGTSCDDGDACTTGDACHLGACAGGPPPDCSDGSDCTVDSCDPLLGCVHAGDGTVDPMISADHDRAGFEITPDGTRLYGFGYFDGAVVVLATSDLSLLDRIPVGGAPADLALSPDGRRLAVADNSSPARLVVLDTDPSSDTYHQIVGSHTFTEDDGSLGVEYRPDGMELYSTTQRPGAGRIHAFDPASLALLASMPIANPQTAALPVNLAFSADSSKGYATVFQSDAAHNLAVFSTASHTIESYIDLDSPGGNLSELVMVDTSAGPRLWVANNPGGPNRIAIVDPIDDVVLQHIDVEVLDGFSYGGLCATPDGSRMLVVAGESMPVYHAGTAVPTHRLEGIYDGVACVFASDGCHVFISGSGGRVYKVDVDDLIPF